MIFKKIGLGVFLAVGVFGLLLYLLNPILMPFVAAGILSYICNPLVSRLTAIKIGSRSMSRGFASLLVLFMFFILFVIFILIIVPLVQQELLLISASLPSAILYIKSSLSPLLFKYFGIELNLNVEYIKGLLLSHWESAGGLMGSTLASLGLHGLALVGFFVDLLLVPLVFYYLLRDWDLLLNNISDLIPRKIHAKTLEISKEIDLVLSDFLRGQLIVMLIMSLYYIIVLKLVGLDLSVPVGVLTGSLGFIPYLGVSIGVILAVVSSVLEYSSLSHVIPVLLVFIVGH